MVLFGEVLDLESIDVASCKLGVTYLLAEIERVSQLILDNPESSFDRSNRASIALFKELIKWYELIAKIESDKSIDKNELTAIETEIYRLNDVVKNASTQDISKT